ncbi:MAG TPA: alpha/beta hydrolase [Candidatus Nitrosocosmicus sp.]|nr:alpha/beta hydrolase [Candidatus Nitrosocosmicus sp.]
MQVPIIEKVLNEDAEIYCERRGNGTPLLLIHGAMEDAGFYSSTADILSDKFKVVTYDRRCNSRSLGDRSADMLMAQQARDAASIIETIGDGKAIVVGRSGGAIIGLELATSRPELINSLIVHEPPLIELLNEPESQIWRSFVKEVYNKSLNEGSEVAQIQFMKSLVNVPASPYPPDLNERLSGNVDFFFKHEFRTFFGYMPKIDAIKNNKVNIVTATGIESNDAYYVKATRALAAELGCSSVEFPGHHDVCFWMPKEFASAIQSTLSRYGDMFKQENN